MYYNPTPSPISPASYMDPVPETGVTSIEQRYPMSSHNGVVIRSTETVSNEADFSPNNYEELTRWVLQQTLPPIQTGELASPYLHSMLLYIDQNGKLGREASPSMASYVEDVFTPEVAATFLKMASIASQREFRRASESFANPGGSFVPQMKGSISDPKQFTRSQSYPLLSSQTCPPGWYQHGLSRQPELIPCEWQSQPRKRRRRNNAGYMNNRLGYALDGTGTLKHTIQRTALKVSNRPLLRKYYEKGFEAFQQTNCKVIAKAFVKVVEPRKQVNHPYNGRIGPFQRVDPEFTKPDWWPTGVIHKEPDHLLKPDRVQLLTHILSELRESQGVTVDKLRAAIQSLRPDVSPPERLKVLDEMFHVREMEERYLNGEIDGDSVIHVSQVYLVDADLEALGCVSEVAEVAEASEIASAVSSKTSSPSVTGEEHTSPAASNPSPATSPLDAADGNYWLRLKRLNGGFGFQMPPSPSPCQDEVSSYTAATVSPMTQTSVLHMDDTEYEETHITESPYTGVSESFGPQLSVPTTMPLTGSWPTPCNLCHSNIPCPYHYDFQQ